MGEARVTLKMPSKLPVGYTELEYIESTGTQYINTGLNASAGYKVTSELLSTYASTWILFWGRQTTTSGANSDFIGYGNRTTMIIASYGGVQFGDIIFSLNAWHTVEGSSVTGDRYLKVDGTKVTNAGTGANSGLNMYLFGINNAGNPNNYSKIKVKYFQIYDSSNVLVRDFIPCINPSNQVGMYDLVSKQFFGNSGTGSFIAGPPK